MAGVAIAYLCGAMVLWLDPVFSSPPDSDWVRFVRRVIAPPTGHLIIAAVGCTIMWTPTILVAVGIYHVLARRRRTTSRVWLFWFPAGVAWAVGVLVGLGWSLLICWLSPYAEPTDLQPANIVLVWADLLERAHLLPSGWLGGSVVSVAVSTPMIASVMATYHALSKLVSPKQTILGKG
ncbi:MAG: hypothetical protein KAV82_09895 [Phycisphaerae bacterium]|nr:hypothetical protein [Phycisphaerae bacterium]